MLKDENIICISSIDWDFIWQGHQEIMATFAKNGNRVLFIENTGVRPPTFKDIGRLKKRLTDWLRSFRGFRNPMENLYVYSPLILPFPYSKIPRWINRHLMLPPLERWFKIMKFYDPLIWTFLPTGTALDIINNLDKKLLVYYCIADFEKLVPNPKKVRRTERLLLKLCDLIFAQGEALEEKCKKFNENVFVFPFGVNTQVFKSVDTYRRNMIKDLKDIKRPIIGYTGGVHRHIDFDLLRFIVMEHPEWSIVLIGPIQTDVSKIQTLKNIFLLGKKDFSVLPNYINEFDVCIIPYLKTEYTQTVYPTKLNEYHSLGKPVVSTDIPEVIRFNRENYDLVKVGSSYKEFVAHIEEALKAGNNADVIHKRTESAKKNDWIDRIGQMSNLIEKAILKENEGRPDWKERFIEFYKNSRKIASRTIIFALISYLFIFYTPILWFIASPLKISQNINKADAIVVFAGGVGESGKAGQGYEERIQYAVELYKNGYAPSLILSSGYTYVFKETEVMKVLAVSMGVPEGAILLEEKAANTYQNVKFTKEILEKKGWDSILLVSSPYHMRRTNLVFKKIAKEIKVIYTPIPKSIFYSHDNVDIYGRRNWKQINLQQIRAILHEYLGILYYWWKGYA